ncbi:MAG TPA: hypothetical protein DEP66_05720, partial [Acidimicrobiaceae bacterium]|nr:hypothetical protein [Acidimicrobiaceae bacterium]
MRATGRAAPVLGCVGLLAVAGEGHITSVAVSPDAQGRRVGAALMLALHRAVRAGRTPDGRPVGEQVAAVEATTLEVRVSNHR